MKSLILMGPGRAGSTLVLKVLSYHPKVQFISNYNDKFPSLAYPKCIDGLYRVRKTHDKCKLTPKPSEPYNFFEYYAKGFKGGKPEPNDYKTEAFRAFLERSFSPDRVFVTKITGYTRFSFFEAVLPASKVLWIERDPVKVVASMYKQKWGGKYLSDEEYIANKAGRLKYWCDKIKDYYKEKNNLSFDCMSLRLEEYLSNPKHYLSVLFKWVGVKDYRYFDRFEDSFLASKINKGENKGNPLLGLRKADYDFLAEELSALRKELGYADS